MTIALRPADERGVVNLGWLHSKHTFSFGHYHDPAHMGFGPLRVINEDRVLPGEGFPPHGHRDMEIVSYVLDGALEHRDSIGNGSVIRPGEVQRMSAGSGIRHSEYNASTEDPVHFLQIWILPAHLHREPGYQQQAFAPESLRGRLRLVASADGHDGTVTIDQDIAIHAGRLEAGDRVSLALDPARIAWVHLARGTLSINGHRLGAGDGAALSAETAIEFSRADGAEVLVFDMAM